MSANKMELRQGTQDQIVFDRLSDSQTLRCVFDFKTLTAEFEEL